MTQDKPAKTAMMELIEWIEREKLETLGYLTHSEIIEKATELLEKEYASLNRQGWTRDEDYWKKRCEAAEAVIERFVGESVVCSPCTPKGKQIYDEWRELESMPLPNKPSI